MDLIVCNPPWLPTSFLTSAYTSDSIASLDLDNAVYDPKEFFLNSCLNFAKFHLNQNGEMLMIYSDFA